MQQLQIIQLRIHGILPLGCQSLKTSAQYSVNYISHCAAAAQVIDWLFQTLHQRADGPPTGGLLNRLCAQTKHRQSKAQHPSNVVGSHLAVGVASCQTCS